MLETASSLCRRHLVSLSRPQHSRHLLPPSLSPFPFLARPFSRSWTRNDDDGGGGGGGDVESLINRDPRSPPRLFVVQPRLRPDALLRAKLNEALCLANSLEDQRDGFFATDFFDKALPPHAVVQNPLIRSHRARADMYFGPGTVENIKIHLNEAETKGEVDAVFVNTILSGIQLRNLERHWGKPVLDRVGLIIEIFNAHAFTKEAKLQAQLAALMYKKTRLVRVRGLDGRLAFGVGGEAEVVSARGRGSGGRGFLSGAGESELHLQRRRISERWRVLESQIEEVRRTRASQRAGRKRHKDSHECGLATVAIVGYTNAGKSTLVGALSDTDLYSDDRLFATLDPRLRSVILPSGRKVLLSDTVGFISDLPVQLVKAFHATLEEVIEADLLVHVLDSSAPNLDEHRSSVLLVLEQIGVSGEKLENMIEVWNKIDLQEDDGSHFHADVADEATCTELIDEDVISDGGDDCGEGGESIADLSEGELEETIESEQDEYSDTWLSQEDDTKWGSSICGDTSNNESNASLGEWRTGKVSDSGQIGPHVKTSAMTGVGLQELLELIDEKLEVQSDRLKKENVVERSIFYSKWRPPRMEEDARVAIEQ
ncbi:GTP-binding protein At3g49725, chloroplastic [Rhodamnia argentea]|uniref:GTP-binding protein At3g49725, chloroplastic n=1 Tax=Rhodamnia argentea TaxID=178133 RepID=A0A8B8PXD6_9MYRT|nr:GTP-binding protein At3g49725, chloroplastic [Rhodamnia argentea]